ncbi:MAG TPA: zinc ribbon domain-containing protein [Herpetosiphonaceae bacterium]
MSRKKRFCPACDTPVIITSRHCDNCGLLLPWSVPLPAAAQPDPPPAPAATPPAVPPAASPPAQVAQPAPAPLKWQAMLALGLGMIGLALTATLAASLLRPPTPTPTPTIPISVPPITATPIARRPPPTPIPPTPKPFAPLGRFEQIKILGASASTELSPSAGALMAVDGKDSTFWQANYAEQGTAWIELRVEDPAIVSTLIIHSLQPLRNLSVTFADGSVQRRSLPEVKDWQTIDIGPARTGTVRITFEGVYAPNGQTPPQIDEIQVWGEYE